MFGWQVFKIETVMGAFNALTKKPSVFWSNHGEWMRPLIKKLSVEDRARIDASGVKLARKRKRAPC